MIRAFHLWTLLWLCPACRPQGPVEAADVYPTPPNIVFILADDLGYGDLSCYGQRRFATPNIDRLAREGLRFTQHYAGSTVCAPSRSALLTGLHTGHTFIRGNREVEPEGQWPLPDSIQTLPEVLRKAGYVTGAFGKWGLGYPGSTGAPEMQGFDRFYGYNCQRQAHNYYPYHLWDDDARERLPGNRDTLKGSYAPELIHREALDFLTEHRDTTFFLFYPHVIPHAELAVPDSVMLANDFGFGEAHPWQGTDAPGPGYKAGAYGSVAQPRATFAAMVRLLDRHVGDILNRLEELGLRERTLVVFTSDNGPHREGGADPDFFDSNGPFRGYKRDLYEGGIRVPLIVSQPGSVQPGRADHVSAFWDVLPTLAEAAAIPYPDATDGISFLPLLRGHESQQPKHDHLYWEFHELGGRQAIRSGKWKGVRYDVLARPEGEWELYDLTADPGETTNLADRYPGIVQRLDSLLQQAREPSPDFPFPAR